ncbi:hypothetical protein [uncultured Methanosphaera sp.]|uniref:hypothetical protein n=1 Tax=uncultured Methanosphaera sp. TaxID=262501 RepID=UPI002594419F|nr:hypothetical protein [uncultured Methanosphaera sp.]
MNETISYNELEKTNSNNIHPYSEHSKTISTDDYFKQLSSGSFPRKIYRRS